MATYLNQDKNAILNEVGGGIEYYDAVIKTTYNMLYYLTQGFTVSIPNDDNEGGHLIKQLNKGLKSLNPYLIIDGKMMYTETLENINKEKTLEDLFFEIYEQNKGVE